MNWSEYKNHYSDFLAAMFRSEVITFYADRDIPNIEVKQPDSEKRKLPFFVGYSRRRLAEVSGGYRTDHGIIEPFAGMIFDQQKERFISYQELPFILAHLEAFLAHSLTALWTHDPTLLSQTSGHPERLRRRSLSANLAVWTTAELDELIESTIFEMFRKPLDSFSTYIKAIGITLPMNLRPLIVADLKRNIIIHNGGIVNDKFLSFLNSAELKSEPYVKGQYVPISYDYVGDIFNQALQLAEDVFVRLSQQFLGVVKPLEAHEETYIRQSMHMPLNPLEGPAKKAVQKLGGSEAVLALVEQLMAQGMSEGQAYEHIIRLGNEEE